MAFKGWRGEMGRREEYSRRSLLDWRTYVGGEEGGSWEGHQI